MLLRQLRLHLLALAALSMSKHGVVEYIAASSSSSSISNTIPISLQNHGVAKTIQAKYEQASELAAQEQQVEDYNAIWVASAKSRDEANSKRRLICLPLDDRFDPPMGTFGHGHVQNGDKMSLPRNFFEVVKNGKAEVPWLYQVSRVEGVTKPPVEEISSSLVPQKALDKVVGGPLDFRAPSNYCFLPW